MISLTSWLAWMVLIIVGFQLFRRPHNCFGPHSPASFIQSRTALVKGAQRLHIIRPLITLRHAASEHWWYCKAQTKIFSNSSASLIVAILGSTGLEYNMPGVFVMAATCSWDISPMLALIEHLMKVSIFCQNKSLLSVVFISSTVGASLSHSSM